MSFDSRGFLEEELFIFLKKNLQRKKILADLVTLVQRYLVMVLPEWLVGPKN